LKREKTQAAKQRGQPTAQAKKTRSPYAEHFPSLKIIPRIPSRGDAKSQREDYQKFAQKHKFIFSKFVLGGEFYKSEIKKEN